MTHNALGQDLYSRVMVLPAIAMLVLAFVAIRQTCAAVATLFGFGRYSVGIGPIKLQRWRLRRCLMASRRRRSSF